MPGAGQGAGFYTLKRSEALRYLGYAGQDIDASLEDSLEEVFTHCENISRCAWIYRVFPIDIREDGIHLPGTTLVLQGNDIGQHMEGARFVAVMAVTCGLANERELQHLTSTGGLAALAFDAAGSALVEAAADACNAAIVEEAHSRGLYTNWRYGPGYGDLPLSVQPTLVHVLDADKKLGMSVTESNLLIPAKSITAFVGFFDTVQETQRTCQTCSFAPHCSLRKAGTPCFQ